MTKDILIFWSPFIATMIVIAGCVVWRIETSLRRVVSSIGESADALGKGFKAAESALYKLKSEHSAIAKRQAELRRVLMDEWKSQNTEGNNEIQRHIAALIKTLAEGTEKNAEIGEQITDALGSLGNLTDMRNLLAKGMPRPGGVHV